MRPPIAIGVIGADRHAEALAGHEAPLPGGRVLRWAPSPCGRDRDEAIALAERTGAAFAPDWSAVVHDSSLPAVFVMSGDPGKIVAVDAALLAGKVVLCPVPAATRTSEVERLAAAEARGRGALLSAGALRHTPAGKHAARLVAGGELGALHSVYAAGRFPRDHTRAGRPVLEEAGWEIVDFLLAVVPAPVQRIHAHAARLFGAAADDTAVLTIRFEGDVIATVELSRCLPPSIPTTPMGEIEVELIGSRQAVRLEPYAPSLHLFGAAATLCPWIDDPVMSMMQEAVDVVNGDAARVAGTAPLARAVAVMDAAR